MSTIISASRRTDIPAFYMPWFMNRLDAGTANYPNPITGKPCSVSLHPDDVHSIVFWSKHYGPFLPHIDTIQTRGYRFYCHYTITGAPRLLEPHVPQWQYNVDIFRRLTQRASVQWRFDPMVFTPDLDAAYYLARFREIAAALEGSTTRCYFSFATFYGKVQRRMHDLAYMEPSLAEKQEFLAQMAESAAQHGITLYSCCADELVDERIHKAHCIDGDLLAELFPDRPLAAKNQPSRAMCGCVASRDIGVYDTCPFGCIYCYANQTQELALTHHHAHDPACESLLQ
jgi:hypothetical protein